MLKNQEFILNLFTCLSTFSIVGEVCLKKKNKLYIFKAVNVRL